MLLCLGHEAKINISHNKPRKRRGKEKWHLYFLKLSLNNISENVLEIHFGGFQKWHLGHVPPPLSTLQSPRMSWNILTSLVGNRSHPTPQCNVEKCKMWSSKMSRNSQIVFLRYSETKPIVSFVSYCLFNPSTACIFGTNCPISVGFSPN